MTEIEKKSVAALRVLSAETVERAKSGHPGMAIGSSPIVYALWRQMKLDPKDPACPARDRFVLSAGHVSALYYSLLHLYGFGVTLEDMKTFRKLGSITPGHPEHGMTPGVEASTGPLGQGIAMGVGMALAESHLAAHFNRPGFPLVDNYTYVLCGDGCLMEGVAAEAASFAGQNKLGKLIVLYDRNQITIEGGTDLAFSEDVAKRHEAYGWQVLRVKDGESVEEISAAIEEAKKDAQRPSLIIVDTVIAVGTPKAGKSSAHGEPLGEEALKALKASNGWPVEAGSGFEIPQEVYDNFAALGKACAAFKPAWEKLAADYAAAYPELWKEWQAWHETKLPGALLNDARLFDAPKPEATRASSGKVLNVLGEHLPALFGGSADLAPSNKTELKGAAFYSPADPDGRNIHFGIREFAMAAMCNGMALYGGVIPYCATFFVFSDYLKPALRLSALMGLNVLYVLTHDSIGVGEDGPTHEPIEQLAAARSIPGVDVYRPADMRETAWSYLEALKNGRPAVFALSRQNLPQLDGTGEGVAKGGYVLREAKGSLDAIVIATGSELQYAVEAAEQLEKDGIGVRVVSMPSTTLFERQSDEYRASVLPPEVRARVSIEAGSTFGWARYVGLDGVSIGIDTFGASGPAADLYAHYGLSAKTVADAVRKLKA